MADPRRLDRVARAQPRADAMSAIARPSRAKLGFDTEAHLNGRQSVGLRSAGYELCGRYVSLPNNPIGADIDADEFAMLIAAGFEVILFQHVRSPPWHPEAHSGVDDGECAAAHALRVGYPLGAHLWLDLEGIASGAPATIVFAEAWQSAVRAAGFSAGCYSGYDVPLSPEALYLLHGFNSYASDAGPRSVATRGYWLKQHQERVVAGVRIDHDTLGPDLLGDVAIVAAAADPIDAVA
jgi:Domain of unknown function (DUF1906)